jgi:hypothetical protein
VVQIYIESDRTGANRNLDKDYRITIKITGFTSIRLALSISLAVRTAHLHVLPLREQQPPSLLLFVTI